MKRKRNIFVKVLALGVSCILFTDAFSVQAEPAQQTDTQQEQTENTQQEDVQQEVSAQEIKLHMVSENSFFRFDYDEEGADVYITDKRSGKVWSNTVDESYYKAELSNRNMLSQLMAVTYATEDGRISIVNIFDNGEEAGNFELSHRYEGGKVILSVLVADDSIAFDIYMWVDEQGFSYEIPVESIKETGKNMLVNIQMMPAFGAAISGEDGFTLIPDGSGALMYYKTYDDPNARLYTYPFYGTDVQDIEEINENREQGYQNLMLPVYGISHHDGAMLAAVTEGEADTVLNISPSGFQFSGLNRAYLTFNYRIYYSTVVNGGDYIQIVPNNYASTRSVKIFLLDGEHNTYSDMAVAYREYLESTGELTQKENSGEIPLVVNLVMGANEKSLLGSKLIAATTYSQAAEIAADLGKNTQELYLILDGWGSGGCDMLPTSPSLERKFGGTGKWKELTNVCRENGVSLYLNMDFVNADEDTGDFNNRKDTIRSGYGSVVNSDGRYLLNPVRVLEEYYDKAVSKMNLEAESSIQFDTVGSLLTYDHSKSSATSRTTAQQVYEEVLAKAAKEIGNVAVEGGNQYVLPYASLVSEIPGTDSEYYLTDKAVPFYQIVVHGCVDYTSTAGNHAYDLQYQKLKWVETGSLPYFILTHESPVILNTTSRNNLFSSQYSVWHETVKEIAQEFNDKLGDIWNQQIARHEEKDGLILVTYEDGTCIYINYTEQAIELDGVLVPAMDYSVIKGA